MSNQHKALNTCVRVSAVAEKKKETCNPLSSPLDPKRQLHRMPALFGPGSGTKLILASDQRGVEALLNFPVEETIDTKIAHPSAEEREGKGRAISFATANCRCSSVAL